MSDLRSVLDKVKSELLEKDKIRDDAYEKMRKATSLSKQAILLIHQKKLEEANEALSKAKELITSLQLLAKKCPEIVYGGMFSAALQEHSEACILLKLFQEDVFISPETIRVPSVDYILGLADVVGELRRLALDALREGEVQKGEKWLGLMDEIYIELMGLDEAYMLVPGLRHKNDVARRIIEATRGDVTQEVRRKSLEEYLKRFEQATKRKRKTPK